MAPTNIVFRLVAPEAMRYPSAGDWWSEDDGTLVITAVATPEDPRSALLVQLHELHEALFCLQAGVTESEVTTWDVHHLEADEPGEVAGAPYAAQHNAALLMERFAAMHLGLDWEEHEQVLLRALCGQANSLASAVLTSDQNTSACNGPTESSTPPASS